MSVENAAKLALAYAGSEARDKQDMIASLGEWPAVGNAVKAKTGLWRQVPYLETLDPNLTRESACRTVLHQNQVQERVFVIKNDRLLREIQGELRGEHVHIYVIPNRDPRIITETPSIMLFKVVGSRRGRSFAVFPQEVEKSLCKEIAKIICH